MYLIVVAAVAIFVIAAVAPFAVIHRAERSSTRYILRQRALGFAVGDARGKDDSGASGRARQKLIQGKLRELERKRAQARRNTLRHLILQSGLDLNEQSYWIASLCVGVAIAGCLILFGKLSPLVAVLGGAAGGFLFPRMFVNGVIRKRQAKFTEHFSEALDILVRGTRTGLPVGECLRMVGREVPDPVGFEFRFLVESVRLGMALDAALERSLERMPVTELQFFSIVLIIQQETGGNLAATLENLSNVLRSRKKLRDKVQALSAEAKASAGIIGSLPFVVGLVIYLASPGFIMVLFTTKVGNFLVVGGLTWMLIGVLVMRQMINFKV